MLHHLSLPVADLPASTALYQAALTALGYRLVAEGPGFAGFGIEAAQDILGLKAVVGALGDTSTSTWAKAASKSRWMSVRTFWALP